MTPTTWADAVTRLGRLCGPGEETSPDGELLRRFASHRDEAAFRALVARHGRMVWGVAVRHAADRHAAEDAFQATFFALARLAGRLCGEGSLAGWLHTVAARTARRTRRHPAPPGDGPEPVAGGPGLLDALSARELLAALDEELARLPDRYRQPLLLCCLEGLSRDEAAARLGWGVGSVKGRLERGRDLLRRRLEARGVGLPAVLATLAVTPTSAPAAVQAAAAGAAVRLAAGGRVAALAGEVVRAAGWPRRLVAAAALTAIVVAAGGVGVGVSATPDAPQVAATDPSPKPADEPNKPDDHPNGVAVRVLADGKPAAGAKVWVDPLYHDPRKQAPPEPTPFIAGSDGVARLPLSAFLGRNSIALFARDAAGRIGTHYHDPSLAQAAGIVIHLRATTRLAGRLTDSNGNPLAGVEVWTGTFALPSGDDEDDQKPAIVLPRWEVERTKVKTGADGRFAFDGVPVGHIASLRVVTAGHGEVNGAARVGEPANLALPKAGSIRVTFAGEGTAADTKGMDWHAYGQASPDVAKLRWNSRGGFFEPPPGAGPVVQAYASGTFDGSAPHVIPNLAPGKYNFSSAGGGLVPVLPKSAQSVEVKPGATADVTVHLTKLAKTTGRVLDAETGKPIAEAGVYVYPIDRQAGYSTVSGSVTTDADGRYVAHLPLGVTVTATVDRPPSGYLKPEYQRGRLPTPDVKLTAAGHAFPDIKLRRSTRFTATVVGDDGKPVPAAVYPGLIHFAAPDLIIAGTDGSFSLSELDPQDLISPRVRRGNAVNVPRAVPIGEPGGPIAISEANAFRLAGRVTDPRGQPVSGAAVAVVWHFMGVGRSASYGTSRVVDQLTTDSEGRYRSGALWPNDRYQVSVTVPGYGKAESPQVLGVAGKTHDVADIRLTRSDIVVRGVVVDLAGNPVGGATVFNRGDGEKELEATADAEGRFTLKGFRDGPAFVSARQDGYRLAAVPADPGGEPVRVVLRKLTDPPAELPPMAAHAEALNKLTRHLLEALWAERARLDGYERRVFDTMAKFDPATARRWAAETKGEKTDFAARLAKAEASRKLLETAKTDPDEALSRIADLKAADGFEAAYGLAVALRPTHREQAARLAEEAVVRARGLDMPQRAWRLASAGFLVARCGNAAGGQAVVVEAADLAEKLPTDGRNGFYRGLIAGYLAPFDLKRAEALLAAHAEPDEYNRCLALAVDRVAVFDPAAARGLLDRFRAGLSYYPHEGRLFLAYRLAATDPDAAAKLVDSVTEPMYRTHGYVKLARLVALKDRPRAWSLIDAAFAQFDKDSQAFEGWSNSGGPAAVAGLVAAAAKDLGHPDAARGVALAIARRPTVRWAGSSDYRERQVVMIALVLSFVDPPTAGRVLAGVAPPDAFADRAVTAERNWLFAAALVWPDRAPSLIDRRLKTFLARKTGRGGVSGSGLIELLSTLTADDRLKDLSGWASLPRGNEEWEE